MIYPLQLHSHMPKQTPHKQAVSSTHAAFHSDLDLYAISATAFSALYLLAALATYLVSLIKGGCMSDTCFVEITIFSIIGSLTGAFAAATLCSNRFKHRLTRSFQFLFPQEVEGVPL
jgi:hypothetical protein